MSVTANIILDYFLIEISDETVYQTIPNAILTVDGKQKTEDPPPGATNPSTGAAVEAPDQTLSWISTIQKRTHSTIRLRRRLAGVSAFATDKDAKASAFGFSTGPDTSVEEWDTGQTYVCTHDELTMLDELVGEMQEEEHWEYYSPWKTVPTDEWTTPLSAPMKATATEPAKMRALMGKMKFTKRGKLEWVPAK